MSSSREVAFDVLYQIETDKSYSSIVINKALKDGQLNRLDSSFASAIVYGVLESRITLDYIIRQYSSIRIKKIEKKTLVLLRIGVYQLLFMDKVPDSAAVNETVKMAKKLKLYKSSGFINGILRSITRSDKKYDLEKILVSSGKDKEKGKIKYLSVKYSVPEEILEMWIRSYGEEATENMLECLKGRPPLYARVNTLKITPQGLMEKLNKEGIKAELTLVDNVIKISNTGSVEGLTSFKNGEFYIQDLSSNIAINALSPKEGDVVYDVCSAPGGKSFAAAILMNNKGVINAFDLYEHKINLINITAKRLGINIISAHVRNALEGTEKNPSDIVICDVPCSGLGVIRRKPEIRYKENLLDNSLKEIQYNILTRSAQLVKKGGVLMYSTCTLNPEENNEIVEKFLQENKDFYGEKIILPKNINRTIEEKEYEISLFPQSNNSDGFYFAILKRGL